LLPLPAIDILTKAPQGDGNRLEIRQGGDNCARYLGDCYSNSE
jgi:hypothetical protein